jgi:penicillin-binding protein 1A
VLDQGPGLPLWRPQNFSEEFYGPTPLRVGMEKSRNVMTVRLAQAVGMDKVAAYAQDFGVYDKMPHLLSFALGAGESTVLRMTTAYSMLVNGGRRIQPTLVDRVQDKTGRTIFRHDGRDCAACRDVTWDGTDPPGVADNLPRVGDPRTIHQMVSILEGVVQRGTAASMASLGRPLAGKTGTSNDNVDAWFIGMSPDLVVGVYVGFDQPRPLGSKETGGTTAVPIVKEVLEAALKDEPAIPFRIPPGLRMVRVNPATGKLAAPGEKGAIWEGYLPGTEPQPGEMMVLDGSGPDPQGTGFPMPTAAGGQPAPATPPPSVSGTGGLY